MTDPGSKIRILVVDDEQMIRRLIESTLTDQGYEVYCAADGEDGVAMTKELLPNLVLTDVVMPGVDGFEMCRRLRQDPATAAIPIIFITVLWEEQDYQTGFNLGVDDYLSKPFRSHELIRRVRAVLLRSGVAATAAVPAPAGDTGAKPLQRDVLLAGRLSAASIPEVLQTLGLNVHSCRLEVHSRAKGVLDLRRGELFRAEVITPRRSFYGFKAWLRIAGWTQGDFELIASDEGDPEPVRNIEIPMQALLLEAAIHRDDVRRLRMMFPPAGVRLRRQGSLPPTAGAVEQQVWTATSGGVDLDDLLDELDSIDRDILRAVLRLRDMGLLGE